MDLCLPAAQELNLNPSLLTGFLEEKFGLPAVSANILRKKFLTADKLSLIHILGVGLWVLVIFLEELHAENGQSPKEQ